MAGTKTATEALPGFICESPLSAGSTPQNSVEGISTKGLQDKATCYSRSNNMMYRFDEESTATASGDDVILPADIDVADPGRWLAGWISDSSQVVMSDTFTSLNALPFDVTKEGLVLVLKGLTAVNDGGGGTFTIATGLTPDGYDVLSFTGSKSPYQIRRVDKYIGSAYVLLLNAPVAIVLPTTAAVEVTQELAVVANGPWDRPTTSRLRWTGQDADFDIGYTLNFTGTPGDRIKASYTAIAVTTPTDADPIVEVDISGYASLTLAAKPVTGVTNTTYRMLVRNLTAGRNITPVFLGVTLTRRAATQSLLP